VRQGNHFAINYVSKGSDPLVKEFGGGGTLKGADRFLPGAWTTLKSGAPALVDSVGVIDCQLDELIERHGAVIALGKVVAYTASALEPMISFRGGYI
jgi:flavin reductase (DIM6/NTAB) family NADH-FMN oxidoreductase RutF